VNTSNFNSRAAVFGEYGLQPVHNQTLLGGVALTTEVTCSSIIKTNLNGSATHPFVIPSEAEGSAVFLNQQRLKIETPFPWSGLGNDEVEAAAEGHWFI
jgi:hypothetical protein